MVWAVFAFCAAELPRWNTISISGYHMREAGATADQEIGFTLANAMCYIDTAIAAPSPSSPPAMPRWNASVAKRCVELTGPPRVMA